MEAAGQQVTEAGTGRAERPLRRHPRGPVRGDIAGLGGLGGQWRGGVRALLREGEALGTGPFLRLNWQGLEEEGRASEGLPRVPVETGQPHGQGATDLGLRLAFSLFLACGCP